MNRDVDLYLEKIADDDFFLRFTQEQLNQIISHSIFHQYEKNQVLFFHGDPSRDCFFLLKGAVRLEKTDMMGEYKYQDYITEGSFFPYSILFTDNPYPYTGYSQTAVDIMLIPKLLLESLVVDNTAQTLYMYKKMGEALEFQEKRLQLTVNSSAYDRVLVSIALWMIDMGKPYQLDGERVIRIPYPLTINELAVSAGTTRETAGRVTRDLAEMGKSEFSRKEIIIYDEEYFADLVL